MSTKIKVTFIAFFAVCAASQVYASGELSQQAEELTQKLTTTAQGDVVQAKGSILYIDLGQRQGILPGNKFEIIRPGAPLKSGDKIIGYEEAFVAKAEVTRARDNVSLCKISTTAGAPQQGDKAYQLRKKINTVVVAQFTFNQTFNALTKNLQEKFFTAMTSRGLKVVERSQLERVMKEQKMGYSGLINTQSAQKIGQLLGAEGMLLGTISDTGDRISINARMVDIGTGQAYAAAEKEIFKTQQIATMLKTAVNSDTGLEGGSAGSYSGTTSSGGPTFLTPVRLAPGRFVTAQNDPLKAYARSVTKSDDKKSISITVMLVNISDKPIYICQDFSTRERNIVIDDNQGGTYGGSMSSIPIVSLGDRRELHEYSKIAPKGEFAVSFSVSKRSKAKRDIFASDKFSVAMQFLLHKGEEFDGAGDSYAPISIGLNNVPYVSNSSVNASK